MHKTQKKWKDTGIFPFHKLYSHIMLMCFDIFIFPTCGKIIQKNQITKTRQA